MGAKGKQDIVYRTIMNSNGEVKDQFADVLNFLKINPEDIKEK